MTIAVILLYTSADNTNWLKLKPLTTTNRWEKLRLTKYFDCDSLLLRNSDAAANLLANTTTAANMSMLAMFDAFTCIDDYVHSRKDPLRARERSELRKHATTSGRGARTGSERLPIMQKTKTQSWRNTALDDYRLLNRSKDHSKGLA